MFAVPFEDIAEDLEKTPAAVRQLAGRARRRVEGHAPVRCGRQGRIDPGAPGPRAARRRRKAACRLWNSVSSWSCPTLEGMSEHSGWDADERVVDWDEMFGDLLPEQTSDDLDNRDPSTTSPAGDTARLMELLADRPPHYED
jgi:hypothetical protein